MSSPHLAETLVGFFGKLPSKGDFVKRALPETFIEPYDAWLQQVISAAKDTLGADHWLQRYLNSRIWRFCLPAGTFDQNVWLGAMMPSVDKVNRYFPLTIAAALPSNVDPIATIRASANWFAHAQSLLYRALDDEHLDLEDFTASVRLSAPLAASVSGSIERNARWSEVILNVDQTGDDPEDSRLFDHLLVPLAQSSFAPGNTLWWAEATPGEPARLLIFQGMPCDEGYLQFLGNASDVAAPEQPGEPVATSESLAAATAASEALPGWVPDASQLEENAGRSLDEMFGELPAKSPDPDQRSDPDDTFDPDDTRPLDAAQDPDDTEVMHDKASERPSLDSILPDVGSKHRDSD